MELVQIEISRHSWRTTECGCGKNADHIPHDFLAALEEAPPSRTGMGWADNHAYVQSNLMETAVATASVVTAALADPDVPLEWRWHLLGVLNNLAYGDQESIAEECQNVIRGSTWILYEEITSGRSKPAAGYAYDLLTAYPEEESRLRSFQQEMRANLPEDLQPK
ncbi:hypothetical protein ABCR94_33940 [Streptomyces sp. 21So2-11]|uniref:hypothetical protein n=1 Tax=Streptomyces sp. 21So2-11 TaxID=3144408 RepID=UPI00321BAB42